MQSFLEHLEQRCRSADTLLCVGLDPRPSIRAPEAAYSEILGYNRRIIDATAQYAACFKPNIAFYERFGPQGLEALEATCAAVPTEIPILLDAKRGDIGATAAAYADAVIRIGAGAVTVNGYLGREAIDPFLVQPGLAVFVLVRTSNPGSDEIQALELADMHPRHRHKLFEVVAERAATWSSRVGVVVAGNVPDALALVRRVQSQIWILAPGIGAQGGSATEAVAAGLRGDGLGLLVAASRSIAESDDPGHAARELRDEINAARAVAGSRGAAFPRGAEAAAGAGAPGDDGLQRGTVQPVPEQTGYDPLRNRVLDGLIEHRCFRTGRFTLKDGSVSPFYVDLRRVVSTSALLTLVAEAYVSLLEDLSFDRLAAIPIAALPLATAVALRLQAPLVYPRISAKQHGSGNRVEGEYSEGERVVLLDDVITSGVSKLEAIGILRDEGLQVTDLVVLLERGAAGRRELETAGVMLHAYAHVRELLQRLRTRRAITENEESEMLRYLARRELTES